MKCRVSVKDLIDILSLISEACFWLAMNTFFEQMSLYRGGPFTWVIFNFFMAANVTEWQRSDVNHVLIFDMDPRSHLQPATFLEIACTLGILWTLSMLGYLCHVPWHPLALILIMLLLLLLVIPPADHELAGTLARWTMRLMTAPLHYVGFADFWMGDQLNSLLTCLVDHYYIVRLYTTYWLREGAVPPYLTTDLMVIDKS